MNEVDVKYRNGKQEISVKQFMCTCGGIMNYIDCAGCPHDDNWTYFYQCADCKILGTSPFQRNQGEDLRKYGWEIITNNK